LRKFNILPRPQGEWESKRRRGTYRRNTKNAEEREAMKAVEGKDLRRIPTVVKVCLERFEERQNTGGGELGKERG